MSNFGTRFSGFFGGNASGGVVVVGSYGAFYDTTTQTIAINTPTAMKLNTTDATLTSGFSITNNILGNPTRITATNTGKYNLQFSAQLNRVVGGTANEVNIWIRKNEINVPNTNTGITLQSNAKKLVAAWNFFVQLNAGQYVELMWSQDDNIEILYENATTLYPATPSVIATINQVG